MEHTTFGSPDEALIKLGNLTREKARIEKLYKSLGKTFSTVCDEKEELRERAVKAEDLCTLYKETVEAQRQTINALKILVDEFKEALEGNR